MKTKLTASIEVWSEVLYSEYLKAHQKANIINSIATYGRRK